MRGPLPVTLILAGALLMGGRALAQAPVPAPSSAPAIRVGYVDVERVAIRSQAGIAAREQLEREKAQMQRELEARKQELEKLREEFDKKGSLLAPEARREKQEQLEKKEREASRILDDFRRDLTRKEQQFQVKILRELSGIIERVGKQKGYHLIVERRGAAVLYATPEADLTDEVIRAYDQESAKGKP